MTKIDMSHLSTLGGLIAWCRTHVHGIWWCVYDEIFVIDCDQTAMQIILTWGGTMCDD